MKKCFFFLSLSYACTLTPLSSAEELHFSLSAMLKKWLEEEDGATWPCRVCHYSNWKKSPPYTCINCGIEMGKG